MFTLLAVAGCHAHLAAQEVDAYAEATFDAGCNCVYGTTSFDEDYTAYYYYDTEFDSQLSDQQGTYSATASVFDDVAGAGQSWTVNDPPADDAFSVSANASGDLDPMYTQCETGSCGQYCNFRNGGSYCYNWCIDCPVDAPFALPDSGVTATITTFCPQDGAGPGDLTAVVGEYSPQNEAQHVPLPSCNDFIEAAAGGYTFGELPYPNSIIFSQEDYQDCGLFDLTMYDLWVQMIQPLPAGAPSDLPQPLPLTSAYRTPVRNSQVGGSPNEGHQHGIAFDLQTSAMGNAAADQADARTSWTDITGWAKISGLQLWGGTQPLCIEPFHYNTSEPPYYHVHVDARQQVDSPPLRACGALWTVPTPSWGS